jgi:hypothetical protein
MWVATKTDVQRLDGANGSTMPCRAAERRRSRTYQRMGYMRLPILKAGRVRLIEAV